MAQAKGDGPEPSYKPVDAYAGTDPPEWNDLLRGILVALVEKNTLLHQINLQISKQDKSAQIRSTKEKVMEVFANQIATVLQNQDPRMNAWAVLEKWCWMMEMYSRAVEFKFNWRYVNSMNFLVNSPSSVYNVYIGSLNPERFVELTHKYATTPEEHAATQLVPSKKSRRFSSGTGLFSPEMSLYMEITKKDAAQSIVVVSTPESMPPVQLVPSTASSGFLLQGNTPMTAESPVRGRRGRAAAKYSTRTRVQQAANLDSLPTSVADILNALSAVSSTTSAPTPPKPDNLKAVSVKEEPVEQKVHEPLEWSKELTVGLIEGIKLRPELWSSDMEAPQDKNQLKDIVEGLRTIPGGRSLTVPLAISAWKMLSNFIRVPNSKLAVDFHLSPDELRSRLQFLVEKDAKASFEATMGQLMANGINGHEMQVHLQQMLGLLPQPQEISPRENQPSTQKRPRLASPSMRDPKKNCPSPQVVTTWVPPKEEAYKSPFVAVTAPTSNPTATAQILSTSSGIPLPTLFSQSVDHSTKEPKPERKTQVNGLGKRNSTHLDGGVKEDKWTTMGRLVEHTCRELETKDPETAIQLQRELSEVLYRSQLQSLKRV